MSTLYRSLTTTVSRAVVNHIKTHYTARIPEFRIEHKELLVIVTVGERTVSTIDPGEVLMATYNSLSKTIHIELSVPIDLDNTWFAGFIPVFKRSFRHELEHFRQHKRSGDLSSEAMKPLLVVNDSFTGKPVRGPFVNLSGAVRYLLNPLEVEAHVLGIRTESKYRKVKFHVALKEAVQKIELDLTESGFQESKAKFVGKRVYETWGLYALVRFPSLRPRRKLVRQPIGFRF
jgi:hypothetical protein